MPQVADPGSSAAPAGGRNNIPPRPQMPTTIDEDRSQHQLARWQVLKEQWDAILEDWMEEHVDIERLVVWGPPDTSSNSLVDIASQLSTPGLYGRRPGAKHADAIAVALVGEGGFLDQAGFWTKMQQVQFFTIGLGDCLIRIDAHADDKRLAVRIVFPHNVWASASDDEPEVADELWELRLRWWDDQGRWVWAWDQFRLSDPSLGGAPSYRVVEAGAAGADGKPDDLLHGADISNVFLATDANPDGDFTGANYPFVFPDTGKPFIPYPHYRAVDSGELWNADHKRGAYRGTLNAAMNWTYTQHAARDASGSAVLAVGIKPPASSVRKDTAGHSRRPVNALILTPGAIIYHEQMPDASQASFQEIGPGGNLTDLSNYAALYEQKQAVRWGLNPSDLTRVSNNPMSGAALFVSSKGRRAFSDQVRPLFRRSDLDSIRIASALLAIAQIAHMPLEGYTIQYHRIPESPEEERANRDGIDWDIDHNVITQVEVVQMRRPGTSREDALQIIVAANVERREIDALVLAELGRRGLIDESEAPTTKIDLAPTDLASVIKTNEARAQIGLPPLDGGDKTISAFRAEGEAQAKADAGTNVKPDPAQDD